MAEDTADGPVHYHQGIAKVEKINPSYVSRALRLTLLAPTTVRRSWMDARAPGRRSRRGWRCFQWSGVTKAARTPM